MYKYSKEWIEDKGRGGGAFTNLSRGSYDGMVASVASGFFLSGMK
jgi:hypothetical protein